MSSHTYAEEPWPASIIISSVVIGYGIMLFYPLNANLHILIGLSMVYSIYSRLYPPFGSERQAGNRSKNDKFHDKHKSDQTDPMYPSPVFWKCLLVFCEVSFSYVLYRDNFSPLISGENITLESYVQAFVAAVSQLITLAYTLATAIALLS